MRGHATANGTKPSILVIWSHGPSRSRRDVLPKMFNWMIDHAYIITAARAIVTKFVETFQGLPASPEGGQLPADQALVKMATGDDEWGS